MAEIVEAKKVNEIFSFGDCSVPTLKIGENVYFNGGDVAGALGFVRTDKAVRTYVEEEDKIRVAPGLSEGGVPRVYISEGAMYIFAIKSNMPASRNFCRCVKEVLLTIRKTGRYESDDLREFRQIVDRVDRNSVNYHEFKQSNKELTEKMKDPKKVERGRRGGRVCQQKIRDLKKEYKQTKIDLAMFQLKDKLVTHAVDQIYANK